MALAVLVGLVRSSANARQAAAWGGLFAGTWLAATFWWLYISMHTYGGLNALATVLAIAALAAALGGYYALACGLFWRLLRQQSAWRATLLFGALWTMAEMARGTWLTGFGWGAVGYAHTDGPLAGFIPWIGAYGVGMLAACLAAALGVAGRLGFVGAAQAANGGVPKPSRLPPLLQKSVMLVFVCTLLGSGLLLQHKAVGFTSSSGHLSVTLLQGNIPQDEKFQPGSGVPVALAWYGDQLGKGESDLVVAPETAIPLLPQELPEEFWESLKARFATGKQAALMGIPLGDYERGYTNSVLGFAPGQPQAYRYDKHHLVPFGEFIPPLFKWFTRMMNIPLGDFNRGAVGQPSFEWKGQRLAPNICYEDLFGEELGARFADPALAPTIFVNVSNIGWFGDSVAIDQHLQISRMRALEFERPMVRATNTGATVVIDHHGTVTHTLPRLSRGSLQASVEGRTGTTPFAWWVARLGLWPLWGVCIAICLGAARAQRTRA